MAFPGSSTNNHTDYVRPLIPVKKERRSARHHIANLASSTLALDSHLVSSRRDPDPPTYSSLQDFYGKKAKTRNQLQGRTSLPNLSSKSQTFINPLAGSSPGGHQLVNPRKPRPLIIPPLPPHIRRCFAPEELLEPERSNLPGLGSRDTKIDRKFISEGGHGDSVPVPPPPTRFRHPNEIRPNLNKVESYTNIQSKVVWSDPRKAQQHSNLSQSPQPQASPQPPTKSRGLFRSASLPQMSNFGSMQSRYLTDLEWRVCHAVNIYVYKNGVENQSPILIHIPPAMKATMRLVLQVLNERMKFPVGYARTLYKMNGIKVCDPCELEMYNNYVVASNHEKHFKCVPYGRRRSPLLVLNPQSKHSRAMRDQREQLRCCLAKKTSIDSLGYVCPRGSMEVIRGMGCCHPTEGVSKDQGTKTPKRGRSPEKSNPTESRSKSNVQDRSKSNNARGTKPTRAASLSPGKPEVSEGATRGSTARSMDSIVPGVKVKKRVAPVQVVNMLNELKIDTPKADETMRTTDLEDLKRYEKNNNNLVDAIIALQRSEHKFPPVSTAGVSSAAYAMETPCHNNNNGYDDPYKNRGYSESEFEADEDDEEDDESSNDSGGQVDVALMARTNQNPRKSPSPDPPSPKGSTSEVCHGFPDKSGTYKSPRGRTYTIRFHTTQPPSNTELPHLDFYIPPPSDSPSSSSWQNVSGTSGSSRIGVRNKPALPRPRPRKSSPAAQAQYVAPLASLLLIPPPQTVPTNNAPTPDRSGFLTKKFSQEFNLENLEPDQGVFGTSGLEDFGAFGGNRAHFPRHLLQTRGFTPLEEENLEARFWLPLPRIEYTTNNVLIPPPNLQPEIYKVQTDTSVQTTPRPDWTMNYYKPKESDIIPPPSAFRNVTPDSGSSSQFIPPPSRFADDEFLLGQVDSSTHSTSLTSRASKSKIPSKMTVVRRRPTLTFPVDDFIFKKGMKSPVGANVTKNPRRKSPMAKGKPRFRR